MTPTLFILGTLVWAFFIVLGLALCKATANGERMREQW